MTGKNASLQNGVSRRSALFAVVTGVGLGFIGIRAWNRRDYAALSELGQSTTLLNDVRLERSIKLDRVRWGTAMKLAPNDRFLAVENGDHFVVYDIATGDEILRSGIEGAVGDFAFTPDSQSLFVTFGPVFAEYWSVSQARLISRFTRPNGTAQIGLNFAGDKVAFAGETLIIYDVASGQELLELSSNSEQYKITKVWFSADDTRLFSVQQFSGPIKAWETSTWQVTEIIPTLPTNFAVSSDGHRLLTVTGADRLGNEGTMQVWDLPSLDLISTISHTGFIPSRFAIDAEGRRTLMREVGGLKVRDVNTGRVLCVIETTHDREYRVALSNDGRLAAIGAIDGELDIFDANTGGHLASFHAHEHKRVLHGITSSRYVGQVHGLIFSSDDRRMISTDTEEVIVWSLK